MAKHPVANIVARDITQADSQVSWGVQREWAELLPLAWKSIGNGSYRIVYSPESHTSQSWWFMPLHLLAVGLGWTNIGHGLKSWRLEGYPPIHPILTLLFESHGKSIEALEIWLNGGNSFMITEALWATATRVDIRRRNVFELNEFENAVSDYKSRIQGPRTKAGFVNLLTGGGDPQHLGPHFYECVFNTRPLSFPAKKRIWEDPHGQNLIEASVESMHGIMNFLEVESQNLQVVSRERTTWRMHLNVRDLCLVIPFEFNSDSRRWFWSQGQDLTPLGIQINNWGNPRN